ncbi:MAG: DNA polymerase I, partial [Deltaproteobacteria bacterium]|nr:DNA polymerase I [Deltaproteobacteria bacterium]
EKDVEEKFVVGQSLIRELIGLAGDASDGIPGVTGIGFKNAAKLLKEYGSIEGVYGNIDGIRGKMRENLIKDKDRAFLSKELATLHTEVPFEWSLDGFQYIGPDYNELIPLLRELEFEKILKEISSSAEGIGVQQESVRCMVIDSANGLEKLLSAVIASGRAAVTLVMSIEGFAGRLLAASLSTAQEEAYCLPVDGGSLSETEVSDFLKAILEEGAVKKDTDNAKALYLFALKKGFSCKGVNIDTGVASYLLNPSKPDHSIEAQASEYLGDQQAREGVDKAATYCKKVCNINTIAIILDKKLDLDNLKKLYLEMELPLTEVLADMEFNGVAVDVPILRDLSKEIAVKLSGAESSIYNSVGMEFNVNSPKQLSEVLFERLKLKPVKKTKTGFSTDDEVLSKLAKVHETPSLIQGYRQLQKTKSTYVDALLELVSPSTGRIHTSFNQTVTATGRLSSSRPNLQNIPVRGEWAGRIREAFIAEPGNMLLAADYSQIELRIVAHMARDPHLTDAFKKDEDIHARTASEIFGVLPGAVTKELRRRAKAINFGIIYGMGAYGLSGELGISVKEASGYIERYFSHYKSVKTFIDKTIEEARLRGYTTTLFGRRRFIPELVSPVDAIVRFGERMAVNTPIQGTAADMIKAAMIRIHRRIKESSLSSRMILQIHDELVFETPAAEKEELSLLVREGMEGVVDLSVPVRVNIKT